MSLRLVARSVWNNPGNRGRCLRKSLAAVAWQFHKGLLRRPITLRLASGARFRAHPDCVVSSALIYAEWPEYVELQFIRSRLRRGDAVNDVGANVGHMSLLLADKAEPRAIFAFEPTPFTFRRLAENWRLNRWPEENLFATALGAAEGTVTMPDVDRPETKNSVLAARTAARTVEVPLRRLDDFRDRWRNQAVGFFKLDVEGFEREVLAGASAFLTEDRPRLVMFESLGGGLAPEICSSFEQARYVIFQLDEAGRAERRSLEAQNLFAIPAELGSELGLA